MIVFFAPIYTILDPDFARKAHATVEQMRE